MMDILLVTTNHNMIFHIVPNGEDIVDGDPPYALIFTLERLHAPSCWMRTCCLRKSFSETKSSCSVYPEVNNLKSEIVKGDCPLFVCPFIHMLGFCTPLKIGSKSISFKMSKL